MEIKRDDILNVFYYILSSNWCFNLNLVILKSKFLKREYLVQTLKQKINENEMSSSSCLLN